MGVGIVSGVGAKELVVSTLGVMYSGSEGGEAVAGKAAASDGSSVSDDSLVPTVSKDSHISMASDGDVASIAGSESIARSGHIPLSAALTNAVTPAGALAYMVFILLYFPCVATFIAIRNETGSWKWAIITAVYTIVLAWLAAFATYHIAGLFL
jgi:ferrous iron transport protein B